MTFPSRCICGIQPVIASVLGLSSDMQYYVICPSCNKRSDLRPTPTDAIIMWDLMPKEEGSFFDKKHDHGKDRWDLLDLEVIGWIVKVLTYGAKKYSANSWQTVPEAKERYRAALFRHLEAHFRGEQFDEESKLPHIAHAFCNMYFLLWFSLKGVGHANHSS